MSRPILLIILGVLIALTPYSGVPLSILSIVLPLLGLAVIAVGVLERVERKRHTPPIQVIQNYEAPDA